MLIFIITTLRQLLPILSWTLIFSACTNKSNNNADTIKRLEENLIESNNSINTSTTVVLQTLEQKFTDPYYSNEKSSIWLNKAKSVIKISGEYYDYINSIKKQENLNDTSFKQLNKKLLIYKESILGIDNAIMDEFNDSFEFINKPEELGPKITSVSVRSALLTLLQNNIKIIENKIIAFCNTKVGIFSDWYTSYSAIVGQSSSYIKAGEEISITAGVGTFSGAALPIININGKNIAIGEEGFAIYKIKTAKVPGIYPIPVKLDFINVTTGKKEVKEVKIKYTVAKECNQ